MENDVVVEELCSFLGTYDEYELFNLGPESDVDAMANDIFNLPNSTIVVLDNRLGTGPHMEWIYQPGILGCPAREMVVLVNACDGYWTAM